MPPWSQFTRIPGDPRRRYVNAAGAEISRRQYQSLRVGMSNEAHARLRGGKSPMHAFSEHLRRVKVQRPDLTIGEIRRDYRGVWGAYRREEVSARRQGREHNRKAWGPLARLLVLQGFRDPSWTHDVGDTPTQQQT